MQQMRIVIRHKHRNFATDFRRIGGLKYKKVILVLTIKHTDL